MDLIIHVYFISSSGPVFLNLIHIIKLESGLYGIYQCDLLQMWKKEGSTWKTSREIDGLVVIREVQEYPLCVWTFSLIL